MEKSRKIPRRKIAFSSCFGAQKKIDAVAEYDANPEYKKHMTVEVEEPRQLLRLVTLKEKGIERGNSAKVPRIEVNELDKEIKIE